MQICKCKLRAAGSNYNTNGMGDAASNAQLAVLLQQEYAARVRAGQDTSDVQMWLNQLNVPVVSPKVTASSPASVVTGVSVASVAPSSTPTASLLGSIPVWAYAALGALFLFEVKK